MKISRRGTTADHGVSTIELKAPSFDWRKSDSSFVIKESNIKDFSTKSHHSYTLSISIPEAIRLIQTISDAAFADPVLFEKNLEPALKALAKIQAVAIGVKI